jgi:hypothetical protein
MLATVLLCLHRSVEQLEQNDNVNAKVTKRKITWMHIQKTSSWLGDFVLLWACPSLLSSYEDLIKEKHSIHGHGDIFFYDKYLNLRDLKTDCKAELVPIKEYYSFHDPYIPSEKLSNSIIITMVRNPMERLLSGFLFRDGLHLIEDNKVKQTIRNSNYPILAYATTPGISSCQTKMIIGYTCNHNIKITYDFIDLAKQRIENVFSFVGLTEESNATGELFYAMFGHNLSPLDDTNRYKRPCRQKYRANNDHPHTKKEALKNILRYHNWTDEADEVLYRHAQELFYRRCRQYNISTLFNTIL